MTLRTIQSKLGSTTLYGYPQLPIVSVLQSFTGRRANQLNLPPDFIQEVIYFLNTTFIIEGLDQFTDLPLLCLKQMCENIVGIKLQISIDLKEERQVFFVFRNYQIFCWLKIVILLPDDGRNIDTYINYCGPSPDYDIPVPESCRYRELFEYYRQTKTNCLTKLQHFQILMRLPQFQPTFKYAKVIRNSTSMNKDQLKIPFPVNRSTFPLLQKYGLLGYSEDFQIIIIPLTEDADKVLEGNMLFNPESILSGILGNYNFQQQLGLALQKLNLNHPNPVFEIFVPRQKFIDIQSYIADFDSDLLAIAVRRKRQIHLILQTHPLFSYGLAQMYQQQLDGQVFIDGLKKQVKISDSTIIKLILNYSNDRDQIREVKRIVAANQIVESETIQLFNPITQIRLVEPVRGESCQHIEMFEKTDIFERNGVYQCLLCHRECKSIVGDAMIDLLLKMFPTARQLRINLKSLQVSDIVIEQNIKSEPSDDWFDELVDTCQQEQCITNNSNEEYNNQVVVQNQFLISKLQQQQAENMQYQQFCQQFGSQVNRQPIIPTIRFDDFIIQPSQLPPIPPLPKTNYQ